MIDRLAVPRVVTQRAPAQRSPAARSRANSFVSAVLLVLLLATAGWPVEVGAPAAGEPVACQTVGSARRVARAEEGAERAARLRARRRTRRRGRGRCRASAAWTRTGLPPRAPTA
ncbi:MAG: hypothetical protein H6835_00150 [Planctomycetes bacterium]|nr:hypothetical protein [Planctomycetota bacterium]